MSVTLPIVKGVCEHCGSANGHRLHCPATPDGRLSGAAEVTAAVIRWHALHHRGPFDQCPADICYHAHPAVLA